jgi:DNA-binding response OmpR family regulator
LPNPLILLIDDEENLLFGLSALMRRAGYTVLTAKDGKDGLQVAQKQLPALIISDVMMPPPNGFELRKLLSRSPLTASIPFIFLTARAAQGDKNYGLLSGADDYITKPFDRDELLARVAAVLRRTARSA